MDSLTLLSILWRRWLVVLPIALLTVAAGVAVAGSANVRYETFGSELLVTRSQAGEQSSTTPALPSDALSGLVATSLLTPEFELGLREAGFGSDFAVTNSPESSVITVTVTGRDPSDVFQMAQTILDRAPAAVDSFLGPDVAGTVDVAALGALSIDQIVESEESFALSVPLAAWTKGPEVSNPFPVGSSTLSALGTIASRSELANAVRAEVPSGAFRVSSEGRPTAPIISIQASADEVTDVVRVYEIVRADLTQQLLDFQTSARVQPEEQTVLLQLVPPEAINQTRSSTVRAAASVMLLGLGFACLAAILIDLMAQRRNKRRRVDDGEHISTSAMGNTAPWGEPPDESTQESPAVAAVR